jgi:uncharacterized protein YprB with RNaseH-like and TPR domain
MDIKDRIERLKREAKKDARESSKDERSLIAEKLKIMLREETARKKSIRELEELASYLGGTVQKHRQGSFILKEETAKNEFYSDSVDTIHVLAREHLFKEYNLPGNVFLDLETSGLSGGVGTFAFLVGIGYFEKNDFKILQFFLPDLQDEKALLLEVSSRLKPFSSITTFNGKAFDLPLLTSRYRLNMLSEPTFDLHLDLLHIARRVYKRSFDDRSLASLEEKLLGTPRVGDIAGHLIPEVYFNFLRTKEVTLLRKVVEHNVIDVFSMLKLLVHFVALLKGIDDVKDAEVLYSISRLFAEFKEHDTTISLMKRALRYTDSIPLIFEIKRDLSIMYKRMSLWNDAEMLWIELLSETPSEPFPYIELAKFYEHIKKEITKAQEMVSLLKEKLGGEWECCDYDDILKREMRLRKKANNGKGFDST